MMGANWVAPGAYAHQLLLLGAVEPTPFPPHWCLEQGHKSAAGELWESQTKLEKCTLLMPLLLFLPWFLGFLEAPEADA